MKSNENQHLKGQNTKNPQMKTLQKPSLFKIDVDRCIILDNVIEKIVNLEVLSNVHFHEIPRTL